MAKIGRPSACVDELAKAHLRRCVEEKLNIVGTDIDNAMPQIQKFVKEALKEDTDEKEKNDEEVISLDAIRRCWGVKEGKVGKNKLSIIAKAIGYDGWDDFVLRYKDKDPIPMFIGFGRFSAARYNPGDIIALGVPQKYIILRCIDEFTFEIIKKTNITTKEESTVLSPSMFLRELSVLPSQDGNSYTPITILVRGDDDDFEIVKKINITSKEEPTDLSLPMFLREFSVLPSQDGNSYTPTITLVRGNDEEEDIIL